MASFKSLLVLLAAAAVSLVVVSAQPSQPACATKLIPCVNYLNSTSPPAECCNAIRDAVTNELSCLCGIFNSPEIFRSFNINITQALELPRHCGVSANTNLCNQAPPPMAGGPPGTRESGNGASGLATMGMSGLAGLLFLWASLM